MSDTIGWTIKDWTKFHTTSTPQNSFDKILELLKSQKVSPEDPAWISLIDEDQLRAQWLILESKAHKESLPLYGVPVAIKDNIDFKDLPTTAACPSFSYKPSEDSTVVRLLRDAGAIILGKTNLDQFATGLVGVRSPYGRPTSAFSSLHVSGGSSSGSGSVVGRGIVPLATSTDTAGSGRVPAALQNIIGVKPTRGVFSCNGVVPACKSLDCVGVFTLNLSDAQLVFSILAKEDDNDCYSRAMPQVPLRSYPKNATIAIPKEIPWFGDKQNRILYNNAVDKLRATGAQIVELDFSPLLELAKCLYEGTWVAERYAATKQFIASKPTDMDPTVAQIIETATKFSAADSFDYEYKRQTILKAITRALEGIDALCVPTCPLNPTLKDLEEEPITVNSIQGTWTNFVNLADMSALALPAGFREDKMPNGITLIGRAFEDFALMELGERYLALFGDRTMGATNVKALTGDVLEKYPATDGYVKVSVVGAHLKNLPLHWQIEACHGVYVTTTKTSPNYKLYALPGGPIAKPGLRRVEIDGSSIEIEIYAIPVAEFGKFVSYVPPPLGIGSCELISGEWVKGFICEESGYSKAKDITSFGGWKNYLESKKGKKPFESVLVANRGEIAVRIIKTLKKLGITSVAVYSDPDKYAQHVIDADFSVPLHGVSAAETYLNMDKIIKAAKDTNSQAIIPGYGFLSENADFSDLCTKEGIVFVGPAGEAIRKLGLKHSAREIAEKAGVPLVPGSGLVKSAAEAKEIARKLEYPVMVKSTAGGGGIGLQKVDNEEDIERVFETVSHQGQAYFGDSGVFLERFVENARHVEIQLMGDGRGDAIALGERDCSLQRRNQKIIEETPAPNLPETTRQKMRNASEQLGKLLKYKCAGTVEFIYDEKRDEFYFLEVNARLQVEHPITEAVTGLDLVEWMLRIAADDPPEFDRSKIVCNGAAIEARLYAENPVKDFRPSPGQLTDVVFPEWARVDTWVHKGTSVSAEYDPTLAKIIVHGKDRNDAIAKLNKALNETVVYGCVTNIDYLRSISSSAMFKEARVATKVLDSYDYQPNAFEILNPGAYTTVQDYPGRVGYWRIGVPPSGPMDSYSFRLANRIVGNDYRAPAIEITLNGPKIMFHTESVIAVTGGEAPLSVNDEPVLANTPITVTRGDILTIGKLTTGCRCYLAIRGGIDVPEYLGSRSTFALGNMGGFNGRVLKLGDVLFMNQPSSSIPTPTSSPLAAPNNLLPSIANKEWTIGVTCGPHGSPDFFKKESIEEFFSEKWKVHYNSNRFGVRLIGPKPHWARVDGGEAGLHPSNAHDYVYSLGAINFTGDEPVILTQDGPSLGGFVCQAVVPEGELWKVGQVKPGDFIQFVPISYETARDLKEAQDAALENFSTDLAPLKQLEAPENPVLAILDKRSDLAPKVVYRQAGDRYILLEYGENEMDLNISYRVNRLIDLVDKHKTVGIVEMSQGVRSVLIEFDGYKITQKQLVSTLLAYEHEIAYTKHWKVKSKVFRLPMAFEDSKTLECVTRYQETIRSSAPWLPNNVDFIADVNGITHKDVENMLYEARFLVLGLGDVFLGAPCAVPLDPRHRYLGTKYNPSRTYTKNGVVGIGGMYMCIYAMDSPGGYQLVGRTIPIWDKLKLGAHSENSWLLTPFDQVEFYPVSEAEIDKFTEDCENGQFKVDVVDSIFDHSDYLKWVDANIESITEFQNNQGGEKAAEFAELIKVSNAELETSSSANDGPPEEYSEMATLVYSEYSGRFWKPLVSVGDVVRKGDGLIVVEAMKTEMTVHATKVGKVVKIIHKNGDMIDAGDLVVVLE